CLAVLRSGYGENAGVEVDMLPAKVELLGLPEPGQQRHGNHRPLVLSDVFPQESLFILAQEPHPLIVLLEELYGANRVRVGLAVCDRHVEDVLQKLEVAVHRRWSDLLYSGRNVPLDVSGQNLAKGSARKCSLPAV